MNGKLVGALLVAFAATTAFAGPGGRSRGGRQGGGHPSGGHVSGAPRVSRGSSYAGRAVRAPGAGSGAQYRHPVAGTGHGYSGRGYYGRGYYGGSYYGGGYYGRGYYGRGYYPYYRSYYPYYGGSWWPGFSFGLGLYYGSGYGYLGAGYGPFYGYATSPVGSSYTVYDSPYDPTAYASDSSAGYGSGEPPALRLDTRREDGREPAPGELRLVVRPDDASVYVDDRFLGSARQLETLSLAPGPHRIEVVRPGFRTAERTVQVRADGPATVVIEMGQR